MDQFLNESLSIRQRIQTYASQRETLLREVMQIEDQIEYELNQEEILMSKIKQYEQELMELDSTDETEEGWEDLLMKARIVKGEKNQLIKERRIISRGRVNYLKNRWFEREEKLSVKIEQLQIKENQLYEKVRRVSRKLFEQHGNLKYIFFEDERDKDEIGI